MSDFHQGILFACIALWLVVGVTIYVNVVWSAQGRATMATVKPLYRIGIHLMMVGLVMAWPVYALIRGSK